MLLKDLPAGSRCFVDANIFYYHFVDEPDFSAAASAFIARVEAGEVVAYSSPHVMAEAVHKVMMFEAAQRRGRGGLDWSRGCNDTVRRSRSCRGFYKPRSR